VFTILLYFGSRVLILQDQEDSQPLDDDIKSGKSLKDSFDPVMDSPQMLGIDVDRMHNAQNLTFAEGCAAHLGGVSQEIGALSGINAFTLLSDKLMSWAEESVKQRDEGYQKNKFIPFE
jgi:hypothetical protein